MHASISYSYTGERRISPLECLTDGCGSRDAKISVFAKHSRHFQLAEHTRKATNLPFLLAYLVSNCHQPVTVFVYPWLCTLHGLWSLYSQQNGSMTVMGVYSDYHLYSFVVDNQLKRPNIG